MKICFLFSGVLLTSVWTSGRSAVKPWGLNANGSGYWMMISSDHYHCDVQACMLDWLFNGFISMYHPWSRVKLSQNIVAWTRVIQWQPIWAQTLDYCCGQHSAGQLGRFPLAFTQVNTSQHNKSWTIQMAASVHHKLFPWLVSYLKFVMLLKGYCTLTFSCPTIASWSTPASLCCHLFSVSLSSHLSSSVPLSSHRLM